MRTFEMFRKRSALNSSNFTNSYTTKSKLLKFISLLFKFLFRFPSTVANVVVFILYTIMHA